MQLRQANSDDTQIVVQILNTSRQTYLPYAESPHSLAETSSWVGNILIPTGGVIISQLNEEDVGVLATSISDEVERDKPGFDRPGGRVGWIDQLYIAPGHVGKGVGTELLEHALSILPRPIRLWTFQENQRAISFYKRHGFTPIEYTNGENNEEKCPDVLFELK